MELQATRHKVAKLIEAGSINNDVIDSLLSEFGFCPAEGMLFDYKRDVPQGRAILKALKHIAAFHNTYGGYLIFGAEETSRDKEIVPCHNTIVDLDSKQVRDAVRAHMSAPIELQSSKLSFQWNGKSYEVVVVHIPKRTAHEPVGFTKTVSDDKNKSIFQANDVYFRDGDNSIPAQIPSHWQLIYSIRKNPYIDQLIALSPIKILENNLPDRNVICIDFIGREETLVELWKWLGDDFSCVKVLAGEGGLGKTSIAFQYCEDICRTSPEGFDQVVWLSAKKKQFKGLLNDFQDLPTPSFSTARELFEQLYCHLGGLEAELETLTDANTPKRIRELAGTLQSFIVIDDLDSLDINDQKRAIEVCQQMAGSGSRFLFTTRKNTTASSNSAIEIEGFGVDEFRDFVTSWLSKLGLNDIGAKQREILRTTSRGSPLYTESIIRLLKAKMPFDEAIKEWKGKLGEDVRSAALEREVRQLSHEARKILAVAAIYRECSYTELKQATRYSVATLNDCINELQSLFLLHAPKIASESRFRVPDTTYKLICSLGNDLIDCYQTFEDKIKKFRYESEKNAKSTPSSTVGAAIRQAYALLKDHRPSDALKTIDEINKLFKGKQPDLLSLRGWVLMSLTPSRIEEARKEFRQAFDLGQRKEIFFNYWFEAEVEAGSIDGAIDVCEKAILNEAGNSRDWLELRAKARIHSSKIQETAGDREHAITQLKAAADDLSTVLNKSQKDGKFSHKNIESQELQVFAHDELWRLTSSDLDGIPSWINAIDSMVDVLGYGDKRGINYARLADAVSSLHKASLSHRSERSDRTINLITQNIRHADTLFSQAPSTIKGEKIYQEARRTLDSLRREYKNT